MIATRESQQLLDEMKDINSKVDEILHLEVIEDGTTIFLFINGFVVFDHQENQTKFEEVIPIYYSTN